jgi:thiamine biosynthesis protein ThiS
MLITVNGQPREVAEHISLLDLLRQLGVKPEITAVQRNAEIINRKAVDSTVLMDGDAIELIRIVGGG